MSYILSLYIIKLIFATNLYRSVWYCWGGEWETRANWRQHAAASWVHCQWRSYAIWRTGRLTPRHCPRRCCCLRWTPRSLSKDAVIRRIGALKCAPGIKRFPRNFLSHRIAFGYVKRWSKHTRIQAEKNEHTVHTLNTLKLCPFYPFCVEKIAIN